VTIRVGRPVETDGAGTANRDQIITRVRHEIATLLAKGPV
jgi:hypothetical protein